MVAAKQRVNQNAKDRYNTNGYWLGNLINADEPTIHTTLMFTYIYETFFTNIRYLPQIQHQYQNVEDNLDWQCEDDITIDVEL